MLWPPRKFVDKIGIFMFTNQLSNTHSVSFKGMSKFAVSVPSLVVSDTMSTNTLAVNVTLRHFQKIF